MTDESTAFDDVWGKLMAAHAPFPVEVTINEPKCMAHIFVEDFDMVHAPEVEAIMEALAHDLRSRLGEIASDAKFDVSPGLTYIEDGDDEGVSGDGWNVAR